MITTRFPWRWQTYLLSIDGMISFEVPVRAGCDVCRQSRDVDLAAVRAAKGGDYCLINRRSTCRFTTGCNGFVKFSYSLGVYRRLWDDEVSDAWFFAKNDAGTG